jgi:tetratricopeptide (TPR) repeat protein
MSYIIEAMKSFKTTLAFIFLTSLPLAAQEPSVNTSIDKMLIKGNYSQALDTCSRLLSHDSLNAEIYYKMGIAYQNLLKDDQALSSFYHAVRLDPAKMVYNLQLARSYYKEEKYNLAEPIFTKLCSEDSLDWVYGYYLSTIYMIHDRYDNAIMIYKRFLRQDSANYIYLDKLAFAMLKKGENQDAIDLYNKSLSLNSRDVIAIKNLAYLYTAELNPDTAIYLLSEGIKIDSADMDLYSRRAQIYFYRNYNKKSLADYEVLLASGDSSEINLKRAGIGYCNLMKPDEAIKFLQKAYLKDSSDYETSSYLGQSYFSLKDIKKSIYYYNKVIEILNPIYRQMGQSRMLLAESQKERGLYRKALENYQLAQAINPDPNIWMIIANIYDEKLNNRTRAIYYYQKFVDTFKNSKTPFVPEYIESVKKRIEYLKTNPAK